MEEASVAGESPDRSKQRESSAEPTSGSAGSVPEARDPRVAVSREKSSSGVSREKDSSGGGRVDTATRVLSVRGTRPTAVTEPAAPEAESSTPPDEDTDLRTAVSAWVRGAETPKPGPGTSAKPATPAGPDPTSTVSPSASAVGQDTASEAPTGKQTGATEGRTAPGTGTTAGAKADAGAVAGSRPGAEADSEAKAVPKGRTGAKAPAKAPSKTASRAKATAKAGTAPEATGAVAAQAAPDAEATAPKTRTEGAAGTKTRPGAKAQAGASKGASKGGAGDADAAGVRAGAAEDVAAADRTGTKPKAAIADSVATKDGPETGAAEAEPKAADAVADTEDGPEAAAKAKPKSADAEAKPKATDTEDELKAADAEAKAANAEDQLKAADADADAKATAPKATDAEREPDAADADAEPEDAADEPEDADGGDDPQGPPAADDESRTGGAGGKSKRAEGEAQAEPGAVDQATAVFKAVRPKKPAVDQPTTMLKLGGKPKSPESESERTSKFVALRDDMRPAAKADAPATASRTPAPAPASEATTTVPQVGPERTTQQPLPPKPPLDLLAELTNTPPPPETPVRTLVRRVKIWTPLVLLLVIVVAVVQAFRPLPPPTLALTAEDGYTFDGDALRLPWPGEGQGWVDVDGVGTMGHFGKQTPVAIGSVAKTMTAYIVLRDHPLKRGQEGPKIKVDAKAEKEGGYDKDGESTLNTVKAGDHLTEKQALSAVMIPSANNVARLLARWDAGSEAAFVKKMNATARQLGMTGTTYTDPSGLKETTVSTARDQVRLGRAVVKVPALVDITSAASWTDPSGRNWPNYNELPYRIGALGIKTGTTTAAGGNLLFASRKQVGGQTVTVVGAILDQQKPPILTTANEVSKTALLAAQKALTPSRILKKGDVVGYVDDRLGGRTPVVVTKDVSAVGWSGLKVSLSFTSGAVPHTAKAGARVGSLTVGDGSAGGVEVPVALAKDLAEPGLGAKLTRIG
ncbi:D-alanyl-D-alanine carboxypeptidase [Streptomyces sp. NPDC006309]|uniref:D-alanyl-D-alanine carboxypeptidase n=1 Tax=Streptomyces sp. NPDC006309 TaxID=3156749 RepID=UPI0033A827A7